MSSTEASAARTIVIAMDGSKYSDYAFEWYLKNVHQPVDHIVIVFCPEYHTIIQSPYAMADVTVLVDLMKEEEEKIKEQLHKFGDKLKQAGIGGKVKSVNGNPGEVIVNLAKEENATMIVTGTRGMGTLRRTFVGSVSDYVIHHSHVPVLVCRHKDHH